jgi:hypothetical protein
MDVVQVLCFAALSLSGPGGLDGKTAAAGSVSLRAHVIDLEGVQWRADLFGGLKSVEQTGVASVWTAEAKSVKRLIGASTNCRRVDLAKPATNLDMRKLFVVRMDRLDGSAKELSARLSKGALLTYPSDVSAGLKLDLSAKDAIGGVIADVAIDDSHLVAIHTATWSGDLPFPLRRRSTLDVLTGAPEQQKVFAPMQVPEVIRGTATGQWLIPPGQAIVVALGAHSYWNEAQHQGGLRERVIVIDAGDIPAAVFDQPTKPIQQRQFSHFTIDCAVGCVFALLGITFAVGWSFRRLSRGIRANEKTG